jgi:hypothetical protein
VTAAPEGVIFDASLVAATAAAIMAQQRFQSWREQRFNHAEIHLRIADFDLAARPKAIPLEADASAAACWNADLSWRGRCPTTFEDFGVASG